MREETDVVDL